MSMGSRIRRGIAAYGLEQDVILEAVETCGGTMSSEQFDEWFDANYMDCAHPAGIWFMTSDDDAFILGGMYSSGLWGKWLHLTQLMVCAGILTAVEGDDGLVYYSRAPVEASE